MENCGGRILVVDDDSGCRALICTLLETAGYATAEAETGEEALALARTAKPRLVIVDIHLPGGISGYEVCHQLKSGSNAATPVVLISGERTESFDRVAGLLIGADECISKPFAPDELVARVRRLVPRVGVSSVPDDLNLTPRELHVLTLLAAGLRQAQIAEHMSISSKTVSSHIEQLLSKLDVHSRAEAVAAAYRRGLVTTAASQLASA
jgi:DNA-binding NarL/FixJ family response regulator